MTIKKLASLISEHEGNKVEVSIGNIREVLAVLSDIIYLERAESGISVSMSSVLENGEKRARKLKKNANV